MAVKSVEEVGTDSLLVVLGVQMVPELREFDRSSLSFSPVTNRDRPRFRLVAPDDYHVGNPVVMARTNLLAERPVPFVHFDAVLPEFVGDPLPRTPIRRP